MNQLHTVGMFVKITVTEPQAAYLAFTLGFKHKILYFNEEARPNMFEIAFFQQFVVVAFVLIKK